MSWIAVGAAVVGGVASAYGSNQAANAQGAAADRQFALDEQRYNQARIDYSPYTEIGNQARKGLAGQLGLSYDKPFNPNAPLSRNFTLADFQASPGYQFNLQQGQMAIDKSANARGNFYAPQTLQDISRFSQGLASNEFNNERNYFTGQQNNLFSRLYGLTSLGENAAAMTGNAAMQSAQLGGQALGAQGDARAAGIMGATNAFTGTLGDVTNMYLQQRMLQQNQGIYGV